MNQKFLLIVESPTKVKTIQKHLGKEYDVISCVGHVKDLPKNDLGIDLENDFKIKLAVLPDKKDFIAELRKKSKTFGKSMSVILSENNSKSIFIPPGFAHGFCTLSNENYIVYSCTRYRDKRYEIGIKYNDKDLKINWPLDVTQISDRDKKLEIFQNKRKDIYHEV